MGNESKMREREKSLKRLFSSPFFVKKGKLSRFGRKKLETIFIFFLLLSRSIHPSIACFLCQKKKENRERERRKEREKERKTERERKKEREKERNILIKSK